MIPETNFFYFRFGEIYNLVSNNRYGLLLQNAFNLDRIFKECKFTIMEINKFSHPHLFKMFKYDILYQSQIFLFNWQHCLSSANHPPHTYTEQHPCCILVHSFPGFCRLRMHAKSGFPVAFIEYQDVRCAAHVMGQLQGSFLLSSDRGPIRIEYAKSKMAAAEVGF